MDPVSDGSIEGVELGTDLFWKPKVTNEIVKILLWRLAHASLFGMKFEVH